MRTQKKRGKDGPAPVSLPAAVRGSAGARSGVGHSKNKKNDRTLFDMSKRHIRDQRRSTEVRQRRDELRSAKIRFEAQLIQDVSAIAVRQKTRGRISSHRRFEGERECGGHRGASSPPDCSRAGQRDHLRCRRPSETPKHEWLAASDLVPVAAAANTA